MQETSTPQVPLCFRPSIALQPCPPLRRNFTNFPIAWFLGLAQDLAPKDISWIFKVGSALQS